MSQHVQSHTYFISKSYQSLVCDIDSLCELDDWMDFIQDINIHRYSCIPKRTTCDHHDVVGKVEK